MGRKEFPALVRDLRPVESGQTLHIEQFKIGGRNDINCTLLERNGAALAVGDDHKEQLVQIGLAVYMIIIVAHQLDEVALFPLGQFERAGADRCVVGRIVAEGCVTPIDVIGDDWQPTE